MEAENELRSRLKIINRVVWDEQRMRIWSGSKTTRMRYEFQPGTKLIPEEKSFRYHINSPYLGGFQVVDSDLAPSSVSQILVIVIMSLLKRKKVWIGVINWTNYWVWTRKSCRKRIIFIVVTSGITSLEIGSGRTVCWHLREGKTERAIFRIHGLCTKMPPPIIWLQSAKRKEHFSESLHSIRKEKYKLRTINPGDNHQKNYQVWK